MAFIIFGFVMLGLVFALGLSGAFLTWLAHQGQAGKIAFITLIAGVPLALGVFVLVPFFAPSKQEIHDADPITQAADQILSYAPAMFIGALCLAATAMFLSKANNRS